MPGGDVELHADVRDAGARLDGLFPVGQEREGVLDNEGREPVGEEDEVLRVRVGRAEECVDALQEGGQLEPAREGREGSSREGKAGTHPDLRRLLEQVDRVGQCRRLARAARRLDPVEPALALAALVRRRRRHAPRPAAGYRLLVQVAAQLAAALAELGLEVRHDELDRALVALAGHDNVGEAVCRLDEIVQRGFDEAQVLRQDAIGVSAALDEVAPQSSREHEVRVALDVDLEVEQVAQALVVQDKDALDLCERREEVLMDEG